MHFGDRMAKRINIITSKKSLCSKLNALHFKNEVELDEADTKYIDKILRNINFKKTDVIKENRNGKIFLKKMNPINLNVFLKKL